MKENKMNNKIWCLTDCDRRGDTTRVFIVGNVEAFKRDFTQKNGEEFGTAVDISAETFASATLARIADISCGKWFDRRGYNIIA